MVAGAAFVFVAVSVDVAASVSRTILGHGFGLALNMYELNPKLTHYGCSLSVGDAVT